MGMFQVFLRRRCRYLLKIQSPKLEEDLVQPQNSGMTRKIHEKKRNCSANVAPLGSPYLVLVSNPDTLKMRKEKKGTNWSGAIESREEVKKLDWMPSKVGPALIKAEVPRSAQRGNLFDKDRVLKTVKGILNKLTPEKFDVLKGQLIDSGITTPDILKDVISLIFEKAVLEPTFCPMYALLCFDLNEKLAPFPSDELGGKEITFKRILLNNCQEAFEGADNLRADDCT
ncbi:unnamed protein product [Camellia sinensis]